MGTEFSDNNIQENDEGKSQIWGEVRKESDQLKKKKLKQQTEYSGSKSLIAKEGAREELGRVESSSVFQLPV